MLVGQDFSAPNVHAKETSLLAICLYFYIHRYLSLQTAVPVYFGYHEAPFIEKSLSHGP